MTPRSRCCFRARRTPREGRHCHSSMKFSPAAISADCGCSTSAAAPGGSSISSSRSGRDFPSPGSTCRRPTSGKPSGNCETIPMPDASQDAVTSIFLFHELPPKVRRTVFHEFARVLKPGGRLVLVDSLQRGDEPDYEGLLELFPQNFHEPYYTSYLEEDFAAIAAACGLAHVRDRSAFVSKVMAFDKPARRVSASAKTV